MKTTLISALALTLGLGACVDAGDSTDVTTTEPGESARIAMNSLMPSQFTVSLTASAKLDSTNWATQVSTANGRATFGYIVGCALASGTTLTINVAGTIYSFPGQIGLGSAWQTRALTADQAAAISSCVVARLNLDGTAVSISLRGKAGAFVLGTGESTNYYLNEGTFFGNMFPDQGATYLFACAGEDKLATPTLEDLANRNCTVSAGSGVTKCNLNDAGPCSTACTWDSTHTYRNCTVNGTTYLNAATVFVQ